MTTLGWILLAAIWIPALLLLAGEVRRIYRIKRSEWRVQARLKEDGRAYKDVQAVRPRPMDLTEPLGRERVGMPTKEEE